MPSDIDQDILGKLDAVIQNKVSDISKYTVKPTDFTRNRKLNASTTIKTILNMQGDCLNTEIAEAFPSLDDRMSVSAFEQAKAKIKPELFADALVEFNATMNAPKTYKGYRVFAADGSDFSTPYNKDSDFVVKNPSGRPRKDGLPVKPQCQMKANLLYDLENKIYQDCVIQPKSETDERMACVEMLERYDSNGQDFLVIMDRGYSGLNMIEHLNRIPHCHYLIRTRVSGTGLKEIVNLPDKDIDKEISFTVTTSSKYHREHPDTKLIVHPKKSHKMISKNTDYQRWDFDDLTDMSFRVVKFKINDEESGKEVWEVLITNLNPFQFRFEDMKALYYKRWQIETSFRELKYALGGINFHSIKDDFLRMELYAHLIMYNTVSRSASQVEINSDGRKHDYAVDFKQAVRVIRKHFRMFNNYPLEELYKEIAMYSNPIREGRKDKRNLKPKGAVYFVYRVA